MENKFHENDIRPANLEVGQKAAIAKDVKWLNNQKKNFVMVGCPACNKKEHTMYFNKKGLNYVKCNYCSTVYVNPRPTNKILSKFYSISEVYKYWSKHVYLSTAENRKKLIFSPRAKLLVKKCKEAKIRKGSILEVGSSSGFFLQEIKKLNFFNKVIGIEPTPDQAKEAKKNGIITYNLTYDKFKSKSKFNAIVSFETIEHLFSPANFLRWANKKLNKGGFIMMTCPNYAGLEPLVFENNSATVDHEHLNYFNPISFQILLNKTGFTEINITTPGSLDVEIIANNIKENKIKENKVNNFLLKFIRTSNENTKNDFQLFLKEFKLSSHMLIFARKN